MATAFDTPVIPFTGPFADLENQFFEASTRAISASTELYTQVLDTQVQATRALLETWSTLGTQAATTVTETGAETAERTQEATTRAARTTTRAARTTARSAGRSTARATERTTRRAAATTRSAAATNRRAARQLTAAPPFTGYDDLTAEDIVAKLAEQPQTALAEIATYEQAHEKRSTVLQRVAALTGPEPAPGYDELNADDAQKLVNDGGAELAAAVRDYERRHKDRATVIAAAVRHADASDSADAS